MPSYEEKIAAGRLPCCIVGCRSTFADDGSSEIICGKHWRLAPAKWRRQVTVLRRRYRNLCGDGGWTDFPAGSPKRLEAVRLFRLFHSAWDRCKRRASQRAMGL